jgi:hypothetical protein
MKSKQGWILFLLIPVTNLCFCQYPITKKIGEDTVVIMTLNQGEQINKTFNKYSQDLGLIKDSLKIKRIQYDSLFNTISLVKDSFYSWKWKYTENKRIYEAYNLNQGKIERLHAASKLILIGIIILQFSQLH